MKTFREFISESNRLRQITLGPSRSPFGRQRQQRDNSERSAFRRAGFVRNRPSQSSERRNKINFNAVPKEYTSTAITTYPNQSSYARDNIPNKVDDKTNRVVRTRDRVLYLRRLRRQIGRRTGRQVHAVDILPRKDFKKDDPRQLITRGKEYHSSVTSIPSTIKSVSSGKPGDIIVGKASEVMPGSKDVKKGRRKREELYSRVLGASQRDPITNVQIARVK